MTGCCTELDPEALDKVGEAILARIASFGQLLRKHDYAVGLKEQEDAAAIARSLPGNRTWQLRNAFRSLYCSRASDWKTPKATSSPSMRCAIPRSASGSTRPCAQRCGPTGPSNTLTKAAP